MPRFWIIRKPLPNSVPSSPFELDKDLNTPKTPPSSQVSVKTIEIMMSAPVVCDGSGSKTRPVSALIKSLSVRRQPRFQRRQHSLPADGMRTPGQPVGQKPKRTGTLDNTTSDSQTSNAAHERNEQHASYGVHVLAAKSDGDVSLPVDVDKPVPVTSTSRDTAGGVEQCPDAETGGPQKECERPAMSKSHSSLASVNIEEQLEARIAPRRIRDKRYTLRSIGAAIFCFKRREARVDQPVVPASTIQPTLPSSVHDEPPHSQTTQREEKPSAVLLHAESDQRESADAEDAEKTARESEEIENLRRDLSESHSQIAELKKLCEAQSRNLEGSNSFLNTADKSSDSDVIRALQRLNAELQQNTLYMAECLAEDFEFKNVTTNLANDQISAVQRASDHIGQLLAKSLGTNKPEDIPMLLQIALQAYLASTLCHAASSWAFESGHNAFIHGIYQRLRKVEAQAISGRWRSLARVHTVHSWSAHPGSLVQVIITGVSDILLAAGCTAPKSDIISNVTSKFEERITLLVELAALLGKMFDEVISSDFEVFIAVPGKKFEDKMMEDADGDQAGIQEASVLCATHLGLRKWLPVGTLWERGKKQKITVLKAKVVLESFLNTEDE